MFNTRAKVRRTLPGPPPRRPLAPASGAAVGLGHHPLVRGDENARLYQYEQAVKQAFAAIEATLRQLAAWQHEADFVTRAQNHARATLGFELPAELLQDTWIQPLDTGRLYAWCVFETFRRMSAEFFKQRPLALGDETGFQAYLQQCGFHILDVSPCADGRLAHVIRYVLRLPQEWVRRKSYAGAMFDVEDSLQKWVETEMLRHREGRPNSAAEPTRYLKVAVYHHSSAHPDQEGCAAHGSDTRRAAEAALNQLQAFREGVEKSFCCGASIDLLLIGVDTDSDAIRLHLPDADGEMTVERYVDALALYKASTQGLGGDAESLVQDYLRQHCAAAGVQPPAAGMLRLAARLLAGNLAQIDYVSRYHGGGYADIGHQECFIGMGIGFEEVQLRNLTYFAYLHTVEEGAADLDVGIRIFKTLNVSRGLPIPVVIRCDYHGQVPGARARAEARCRQLDGALRQRYGQLAEAGLLHTLLMVRDCRAGAAAETIADSSLPSVEEMH